ncbi:hypothetical protein ENUP19_0241G0035 [Entamoeba nuttalli]|uniref:Uncharacterized protein n=2 Tax=Entamoeba nuttalli TaxID=412467 RepID=K2HQH0_ENTNP|nr:hypothetical protein ENU1_175090 [Entamoeba nuttalli P19]EKE38135.1 hypothetical protein ENU1_175090 [Entamoeba nuttalli P19]|eukprot:XP_008859527.1 hypothetical protein ENU1_175090 [Entamoeba nuttalli P19]
MSVKLSDSERLAERYIETKNYMVEEQGLLIALLNKYYEIQVKLPRKKSSKTANLVRVVAIGDGNDTIDFTKTVEDICKCKMYFDEHNGISEKTAYRRFTNNKISEAHHYLMDLLRLHGYFYNSYYSSGKNHSNKTETFTDIFKEGKHLFGLHDIVQKGIEINEWMHSELSSNDLLFLSKNDSTLQSFIN